MENKNDLDQRVDPFWTIWFPLGISVFLVFITAVSFIIAYFSGDEISKWASAFSSLMISFIIFTSLILIVFLVFSIAGMNELSGSAPVWLSKVQVYSVIGNENGKRIMNAMVKPVIFTRQVAAGFARIFSRK